MAFTYTETSFPGISSVAIHHDGDMSGYRSARQDGKEQPGKARGSIARQSLEERGQDRVEVGYDLEGEHRGGKTWGTGILCPRVGDKSGRFEVCDCELKVV